MDFFQHQDKARKNTKVLVVYFVIAVACIIVSVYVAALLIFHTTGYGRAPDSPPPELALWDPRLFFQVMLGTLGVVIVGSLYKTLALSKGGSAVAESLGGRLVPTDPGDPDERKLRNVVEEMAIAAGVPVPKIYVLADEQGVNAFAAGHTQEDAAIGVTRGCMTLLNRDELQGVIGHEFSHILNGDMRLNLRIMTKKTGGKVIGGAVNGEGSLTIKVKGTGKDSFLSQVIDLVKQSQESKSKTQDLANTAALWLTIVALGGGVITFLIWQVFMDRDFAFAIELTVTVMVIACPHALGLAVPLVVAVSTALAAKNGLLIRNRVAFEGARNLQAVIAR